MLVIARAGSASLDSVLMGALVSQADYGKVAGDNETQMLAWLQHGPLSVSVAAGPFNGYKGGIITGATCNNTHVDHAV